MAGEIVLIAEDNPDFREGLRDILENEGFVVITADHGRHGLDQMRYNPPDVIISDIAMPEMDGHSFFRAVRAQAEWATIPFIFLTGRGDRRDVLDGKELGAEDYLVKPVSPEELLTTVRSRLARARQLQIAHLQQSYEATLTMLANAIEVRDPYTRGHVERVTTYALAIAVNLGWSGARLELVRFGGILHDIGKIAVRESVLRKTGPLSRDEWSDIYQHPITGAEMLKGIPYLAPTIPIIRHHHERWDGQGYPDGLTGESIPIGARVVAVADSFDAMTSTRSYRAGRPLAQAYETIAASAGQQYDPAIVTAFAKVWADGQVQSIAAALAPESFDSREIYRGA